MVQRVKNPPPKAINVFVTVLRNRELANKILKSRKPLFYNI